MTEPRAIATVRDHDELVDALRARKDALGLSDKFVDDTCFDTPGHTNQVLGPSRKKNLGRKSLDGLLITLGCALVLVEDPERIAFMESQWEARVAHKIHFPQHRVSKSVVKRARPVVLRSYGAIGGQVRAFLLSPKQVSKISTEGARARAKKLTKRRRSEIARKAVNARWQRAKSMLTAKQV